MALKYILAIVKKNNERTTAIVNTYHEILPE